MKKTTKALIAFVAICYLATVAFSAWLAIKSTPDCYNVVVPASERSTVTRRPGAFSSVNISSVDGNVSFSLSGHLEVVVREDSLATQPEIVIPTALDKMVLTSVSDGQLNLAFNYEGVVDTSTDNDRYWRIMFDVATPITVVMPSGALKRMDISDISETIGFRIDGLRSRRLDYAGFAGVKFTNCVIDTLSNSSSPSPYRREPKCILEFEQSRIANMIVANCVSDLNLQTDSASVIDVLMRRSSGYETSYLTISEARVNRLIWEPDTIGRTLRLNISEPFNMKLDGINQH